MEDVLLKLLAKTGMRSSSFVVACLGLLLPSLLQLAMPAVQAWGDGHGIAGAMIVGAYVAGRAYVDAHKIKAAAAATVPAPSDALSEAQLDAVRRASLDGIVQ